MHVRSGEPEVSKEGVAHQGVVMLPRMDDERRELTSAPPHRLDHGRDLHKVRPRADDVDDFEHYS